MKTLVRPMLSLFVALSVITGLVYPLVVTGIGRAAFPREAAGSLVYKDGKAVGSALIGQHFDEPKYFWGRPSATAPMPENGAASGGSNLGPLNPALADAVKARIAALREADPTATLPVPADLVTASASGLDPDISPAAAEYQVARVAAARKLPPDVVRGLVERYTQGRQWGIFGEPRVNVLKLNLALDALARGGV
ncbi:potassium-transporting ATPase subunit KdpC [Pandoraea nosoerga]|uniref:Potassium-transporting ATPase KdpC subunit n=1 Tax=Pandoraea nosoerga TaxID=2508296 RepID=A0A5E4V1P9_9BURK|nr:MULTISPECIES: potassium-transporting ATPase subunit KdpC [Pandoraea]MBN4667860.1 potassium-transporting ATPase subunit KdpC [Pandoraea nosoerga]MBN4676534.1 potassium-transporting ATPase subunit KdpC [Pandoraea nosoerga]MBN4682809.1 potassium-transporting ATPase subunit KdpC [Pandoraea nosoerga]MBN4745686.1 potassium-transporting ATPase subunit KdpC [Pandoraea nosoerga]VVE06136.1 potassium-transporting ATPase subunit C [Pandoraea nosoerga]